jgi:hypothetical protein
MIYTERGEWTEALRCLNWARQYWQARDDRWNQANTLSELADLHIRRGHWFKAQTCLADARALIENHEGARFDALRSELDEHQQRISPSPDPHTRR